jgi:signal transduction histidine kinase
LDVFHDVFLRLLLLLLHVQWIVDHFNHHFAGMLQMLMDTRLDATQQDYARTAQASGKALITLINEVLDQAKIESGRLELEAVPFDLCAILDDVLSLFSGKSRDEGIEVCFSLSKHCFFGHDFCTSSSFRPKNCLTHFTELSP